MSESNDMPTIEEILEARATIAEFQRDFLIVAGVKDPSEVLNFWQWGHARTIERLEVPGARPVLDWLAWWRGLRDEWEIEGGPRSKLASTSNRKKP